MKGFAPLEPSMSAPKNHAAATPVRTEEETAQSLESLATGGKKASFREVLSKPITVVAILLGSLLAGLVVYLQQDPGATSLELPESSHALLRNEGLTAGVPVAIQLGDLLVFQISDPMAGGAGAERSRQIVASLEQAVKDLEESPGRVITIDTAGDAGLPRIIQKETPSASEYHEVIRVTADDMVLAETDNAKLLARVWAERLTDTLRFLVFGEPPEFSRDTSFGAALDTLYVNSRGEGGPLTTAAIEEAFIALPEDVKQSLTTFEELPEEESAPEPAE